MEAIENFINEKNISNKRVTIKIIDSNDHDKAPIVGILGQTILIDKRISAILNEEELKSLCLHEVCHIKEDKPSNSFWIYFLIKHTFILYVCSFVFNLNYYFYISFAIFISLLLSQQIFLYRNKASIARSIEFACDDYAIKENGKENFLSMIEKMEKIDKGFFSLDNWISQILFGKFHPSFKDRIKRI